MHWPSQPVSLLSQDIHGPEDREMLARLAASAEDDQSADSEAAIEKYLRSVLAVENILTLDRLRQVRKHLRSFCTLDLLADADNLHVGRVTQ